MSMMDRFRRMFGSRNDIGSAEIKRGDAVWDALTGGLTGGPSENAAMAVTAVYACVTLISGAIASLPMHVYKRAADGDLERDIDNPLWWMLNEEFCPRWSAATGWSYLAASRMLRGDAFAEIKRGPSGAIKGLVPLHPSRVRVVPTPDGERLVYEVKPDFSRGERQTTVFRVLDQDDMLHVPGFGYDGINGVSVLRHALRSAGRVAINAQDFSEAFLRNMARPDFAVKAKGNLSQDNFDRLKGELDGRAGPQNAGRPMILEGGLDIQALTMTMEDQQLLETRKFQVEEVARAFGVQPFMIGHTEKTSSWGTGVEAMGAGFVRYTMRDHLNAFHNEINRKFFRSPRFTAEFDTLEMERGDMKSMFEAVRIGLGRAGEPQFLGLEEGRRILRLPRKMMGVVTAPTPQPSQTGE